GLAKTNARSAQSVRFGAGARPTEDLQLNLTIARQEATDDDTGASTLGEAAHASDNYVRTPFESEMTLYDGALNWRVSSVQVTATAAAYRWDSTRRIEYTGVLLAERRSPEGCQRYLSLPL